MLRASSYLKSLFVLACVFSLALPEANAIQKDAADGTPSAKAAGVTSPAIEIVNAVKLRELVKSWKGNVVLVNLWATWCVPCVKEFPDLTKIQNQYKGQGLKVVGISLDELSELDSRVKPFLEKQAPSFQTYLNQESDPDKIVSVIDDAWNGMIPNSYIIDRSGEVQKTLMGRKSYEEFEKLLTPYLQPASTQ